ncbi:JDVT-CTERM system glutamic-type intramembrane protease [Burkholderiaceae bacterium FT117]|uniref:JDVT-CTERM system glutamic-type intramembrane protease MrtJ n=1 Tax=Zeimonas sediminis TaxID=2944268 RepID=UPI0023430BD1|nr:JDVT-CTERM system glutamic-type intramembrane protease [Zeimonas sediminis]MCM5570146.1 JDVT-CTERM system glutamic-type intramembrane protease [Zeimonas sediminis]
MLAESGLARFVLPLADAQFVAAIVVALPVWLLLGLGLAGPLHRPAGLLEWLAFVAWQPLLEELVFRGLLQGQLLRLSAARRVGPVSVANLLTTAAFAAMHLLAQPPAWALAVVAPSLVFGHLRERFGSVWPAVAMHAVYNAGFGVAALFAGRLAS